MRLSTFSKIWALVYASFGLGLFIIPIQFMATYGVALDDSGTLMSRILGAALFAYALAFWGNHNLPASDKGWRNLLFASFIYNILDIPVVLMAVLDGIMNSLGWIPVGLHVFLAVTFGYFVMRKNSGAR